MTMADLIERDIPVISSEGEVTQDTGITKVTQDTGTTEVTQDTGIVVAVIRVTAMSTVETITGRMMTIGVGFSPLPNLK